MSSACNLHDASIVNVEQQQRALEICTRIMELEPEDTLATVRMLAGEDEVLVQMVLNLLARLDTAGDLLPTGGPQRHDIDQSGSTLGEFELDRLLGSGGMGSVYLAHRMANGVRQEVALKVMNLVAPKPREIARFIGEQRTLAVLHHPYIATLVDAGVTERGVPYLVMEYVPGAPITVWCRERGADIAERVRIWLRICEAVQYAHQNLVVHRDIKPANILVTADGLPKLLDFGVAKLMGSEADGGQTTRFAHHLTLEYATPERILRNAVSTSEDIYAMGVLLFELISGARPFNRSDRTFEALVSSLDHEKPPTLLSAFMAQPSAVQAACASERGVSVRAMTTLLKSDLDAICAQALHPDRERRYQSVEQLAQDVRAWSRNEPVAARGDSRWYQLVRFWSRHKIGVLASIATGTALIAALGVYIYQARVVSEQAERALAMSEFLQEMLAAPTARWDTAWRGHADLRMSELLELASEHLESRLQDQPEVRVELHASLARSFAALSMNERAITEQRKALAIVMEELPADAAVHPGIRTTMATMLDYLATPESIAEARVHLRGALEWFDTYLPGPSYGRAATIGEVGYSHHVAGEFTSALARYLEAEQVFLESGGKPDDPLLALGVGLMGLASFENRQLDQARMYLDRALAIYEQPVNLNLSDSAAVYVARAYLDVLAGEFEFALNKSRRALEVTERTAGSQSLDRYTQLVAAADIHCAADRTHDCERFLDQAEAVIASGLGMGPAHQALTRLIRAEQRLIQGDAPAALLLLEDLEALGGIDRVRTGQVFNAGGRWQLAMGKALLASGEATRVTRTRAHTYLTRGVEITEAIVGKGSTTSRNMRADLARLAPDLPILDDVHRQSAR